MRAGCAPSGAPVAIAAATGLAVLLSMGAVAAGQGQPPGIARFRSGVAMVNITATVTDAQGRFVPNLRQQDFVVYEDGVPQPIGYFSRDRVPVSLGIVLDTSASMAGDKLVSTREALNRFLDDLLGPRDEIFLVRFADQPMVVQSWTTDRHLLHERLGEVRTGGGTAMYDAVCDAVPLAQSGRYHKKALVLISDGNDADSRATAADVRDLLRRSDVLAYAVGIDGGPERLPMLGPPPARPPSTPPWPGPGIGLGRPRPPEPVPPLPGRLTPNPERRVDAAALRAITDDSGGRTEIIRDARDLDPATAGIADELSRQYFLAYATSVPRDGRWHSIRVEVRSRDLHVRARRGFVAS